MSIAEEEVDVCGGVAKVKEGLQREPRRVYNRRQGWSVAEVEAGHSGELMVAVTGVVVIEVAMVVAVGGCGWWVQ